MHARTIEYVHVRKQDKPNSCEMLFSYKGKYQILNYCTYLLDASQVQLQAGVCLGLFNVNCAIYSRAEYNSS